MNIAEFQEKLNGICVLAEENGKTLTQEQIREYFAGIELDTEQLVKILQYLKIKGITIEGAENVKENQEAVPEVNAGTKVPLTPEEKEYLKEYLNGFPEVSGDEKEMDALFAALGDGDTLAAASLVQAYLPEAAKMAAEMNCSEIHLADLIQEANVALLTALEEPEPKVKDDSWLRLAVRKGITAAIEAQTEQNFQDECLVAKVEKLESAVRELTDDDGETRFSVDELAVILDMEVEEIRNILRLTGDDK